jgi:hypothetical protein
LVKKAPPAGLKAEMDRLNTLHPEWGGNENRLRANAKINLSRRPGDSYEPTPQKFD